jgi:hypothetical protein
LLPLQGQELLLLCKGHCICGHALCPRCLQGTLLLLLLQLLEQLWIQAAARSSKLRLCCLCCLLLQ